MLESSSVCTVVIAQFGRSDYTDRCITSLLDNTKLPIDLVLIDSGSRWEDANNLRGISAISTNRLRITGGKVTTVFLSDNLSIGYNRNFGIGMARTPYILSTDNDMTYTPNWLEHAIEYYNESDADLLGLWAHPHHQHIRDISQNVHEMNNIPGNCFFSKIDLYNKFKFKEVPSVDYSKELGEDTDMVWRMRDSGLKLYSVKENLMNHFGAVQSDGGTAVEFR